MDQRPAPDERDRNRFGRPENARPRDRTGRPLPYDTSETEVAEEHEYNTVEEALATGVGLWDQERYFEAHECLEDVWHHAAPDDREFWKGVIQVAVACCHHQRGNAPGFVALAGKAADRLSRYPDVHHGVDVGQLIGFVESASEAVASAGFAVEIAYPRFPRMDDGPFIDPDRAVTPLSRQPAWARAAQVLADRSEEL